MPGWQANCRSVHRKSRTAIETWSEIWFNPDYVLGGRPSIISHIRSAMRRHRCLKTRRSAGCIVRPTSSPASSPMGLSMAWIMTCSTCPPVDEAYGKPFLVAGDIMSMFHDRDEVRAVMEYFTTPDSAAGWIQRGGAFSPHLQATEDLYPTQIAKDLAAMAAAATSFRFDGSDLMPGEVGSGTFWTGMTDYVSGSADLDTVLSDIDASWPE
jgi:alpha-glucoside transport system substrate-binding protein